MFSGIDGPVVVIVLSASRAAMFVLAGALRWWEDDSFVFDAMRRHVVAFCRWRHRCGRRRCLGSVFGRRSMCVGCVCLCVDYGQIIEKKIAI